ncbi:membrane dipeptidase [Chitinophaga polysaccharea]|uniref:membrane dipeptidase n=1 Tax=Chitinophaga polysaccharea TaxID=1293035 RepID=UPI0011588FDB|nr:membrane dipeptidase [Chitinophaga polysaccharea]
MTNKIFDFHFHLLFKHYLSNGTPITEQVKTTGLASLLNDLFGGPFNSQSSPDQVKDSQLYLGVASIISLEHAFARRILHVLGIDFSHILPLNKDIVNKTKDGKTSYYAEFRQQVKMYLDSRATLEQAPYHIKYTGRKDWEGQTPQQIADTLRNDNQQRYLIFSIEGGHNLSDVPIRGSALSRTPELNLKDIQDNSEMDFISINLCHLSYIPEQPLGGFAQGLNKQAQIAFSSEDFMPKAGLGLTQLGKKVVRQALLHEKRPVLIDLKHMSVYTRFHYYRYRESLINEAPAVSRLPIITSHTGFTFTSLNNYLTKKQFRSTTGQQDGAFVCIVEPDNRKIGKTNDSINSGLYGNPWTINLFDEEIIEIMSSRGMIGISLDQRILGAEKMIDSSRPEYFDPEYIAKEEWEKLFRDGQLPGAEKLFDFLSIPSRAERHLMLLCLHIIYAVRVGNAGIGWEPGTSPWDHICIGSDFDGLINPINRMDNVLKLSDLAAGLKKYLPVADKYLNTGDDNNARSLRYNNADGSLDMDYLNEVIGKFMYTNGLNFTARYLSNWTE